MLLWTDSHSRIIGLKRKISKEETFTPFPLSHFEYLGVCYNDHENIHDFDDVYNLAILEKADKPLYEGSNTNLLFAILLIMNLKVMNGLSNISIIKWSFKHINHTDANVCKIIHHIYMIVIKVIFIPLIVVLLIHNSN